MADKVKPQFGALNLFGQLFIAVGVIAGFLLVVVAAIALVVSLNEPTPIIMSWEFWDDDAKLGLRAVSD